MGKVVERIVNAERVEDLIAVFGSFDENIRRIEDLNCIGFVTSPGGSAIFSIIQSRRGIISFLSSSKFLIAKPFKLLATRYDAYAAFIGYSGGQTGKRNAYAHAALHYGRSGRKVTYVQNWERHREHTSDLYGMGKRQRPQMLVFAPLKGARVQCKACGILWQVCDIIFFY